MTDATRIRAIAAGDKTTVRILMAHEMESGQRKDAAGRTLPAWHIQDVTVRHNGKLVFSAACGPSIAKNPYLQLVLKGAKPGDKIAVAWKDNRGESRSDEAVVA